MRRRRWWSPAIKQIPQIRAVIAADTCITAGQSRPQMPQFIGSLVTGDSQPVTAMRSQSSKPARHTEPHVPMEQVAVALARIGQAMPQPPQLAVEDWVSVSQPSVGSMLQSA